MTPTSQQHTSKHAACAQTRRPPVLHFPVCKTSRPLPFGTSAFSTVHRTTPHFYTCASCKNRACARGPAAHAPPLPLVAAWVIPRVVMAASSAPPPENSSALRRSPIAWSIGSGRALSLPPPVQSPRVLVVVVSGGHIFDPREVLEGGEKGGLSDAKVCAPKMARQDFPYCKFRFFPLSSFWSGGGGSMGGGGGLTSTVYGHSKYFPV